MNLMATCSRGAEVNTLSFAEGLCRSPKSASSLAISRSACVAIQLEYPMPRRVPRIILSATLLICAGAAIADTTRADTTRADTTRAVVPFTPYELVAHDGAKAQVERGEISIPENRARPKGRQIKLGFVRFPALHPTAIPPIVYLAGGPGGSGVDAARLPARFAIFQALREITDVIALDQRGTGWSNEIPPCPTNMHLPLDRPTTRDSLTTAVRETASACARYWKDAGVDLAAYNTWESAADIDALRDALGVKKVSLWGISYGSHLALAVLKRYPDKIERVALVGIEGLDETVKLPALTDAFFARLQAAISSDPESAKAYPDFLGTMRRVHARVDREPVSVTFKDKTGKDVTLVLGLEDIRVAAAAMGGDPSRSRMLPGLYAMMDAGDFSRAAPIVWEVLRKPDAVQFTGMGEAMDAASGISRRRLELFERQIKSSLLGDIVNFPMPHIADALGVPDLGDRFRAPFKSDVPVLFMSGTLDGRTYPESAHELIKRFSRGSHLIVENGGHNLFEASPLIKDVVVAWFRGEAPQMATMTLAPPQFPH
jgi:pimeloyl-ACP methyl ester carboxylesterase